MPKNIHLGHKYSDSNPEASESDEPEEHFPYVFISDIEGLESLPEKGTITFDYVLRERSTRKTERKGNMKEATSMELELHSIVEAKAGDKDPPKAKPKKTPREEVEEVFSGLDKKDAYS